MTLTTSVEAKRLTDPAAWRKWGPYLSDRSWGTVREHDSAEGNAWRYFPHDQARSRAYRCGDYGIANIANIVEVAGVADFNDEKP